MSDDKGLPILFDTDMKDYAEIYQHLGCRLYNQETADNGVTRYSLVYQKEPNLQLQSNCSEGLRTYCADREKTQIQQAQIHLHNELARIAIFAWICARNDEVNSFK